MKSKLILALVAALGLASPAQAASGGLQFSLDARQAGFSAKERVVVQLTVSNPGKDAGSLAAWQAPELDLDDALFAVTRDGKPVDYVGPFVKRSAADKSNTLRLDGGAKIVREIDLAAVRLQILEQVGCNGRVIFDHEYMRLARSALHGLHCPCALTIRPARAARPASGRRRARAR